MNLRDLLLRVRALIAPGRVERELDDELTFHIEREAHKYIAEGLSPAEALTRARARFGSVPVAADQCRDARGTGAIDTLVRDLRDACRAVRRAPLAALTIVATIALGLALVTVAFTVYNALFLRADAVRNPDELFTVERLTRPDLPHPPGSGRAWMPFTPSEFDRLRRDAGVLTDAVGMLPDVAVRIDSRMLTSTLVTGNFFQVLAANAALGRPLIPDDDAPGGRRVMVLSDRGWARLFSRDRDVIGRGVRVNGAPFDVVGVMPENFRGLSVSPPDAWVPIALAYQLAGDMEARYSSSSSPKVRGRDDDIVMRDVVGRLNPRASSDGAGLRLTAWASAQSDLRRVTPGFPNHINLTPNRGTLWPETFRGQILPIFFAFGLVLMIGCANVANLLLARGLSRQREIGIRLSLGASRWRIVRQLFTESLVLALAAAACGVVLSRWLLAGALYAASTAMPPEVAEQLSIAPLPIDWRVVLFLAAVAMISTVLFGLAPAVRATRVDLLRSMRGEMTKAARPGRARHVLIALQAGAAALLLISASVFLRSAFDAATVSLGLRTSDTLVLPVTHEPLRAAMLAELTTHPSVADVAASWPSLTGFPLPSKAETFQPLPTGAAANTAASARIGYAFVSPNYFSVLGIDLVKGRGFAPDEHHADAEVVLVSERAARRLWPGQDAVGQVLRFDAQLPTLAGGTTAAPPSGARSYTVVGIVRDVGREDLGGGAMLVLLNPDVYVPVDVESPETSLVLRVYGSPDAARRALLDRLVVVDPGLGQIRTLRLVVQGHVYTLWIAFWVTVVLAGLALALTASGLFSVLSYTIEQRKREIGVRMALGATTRQVAGWVLSQMFRPVGVGVVAGAGLVTALVKVIVTWMPFWLGSVVTVFDPLTYAASLVIVVIGCALAASLPAWRATRIDPIESLRQD